MLNVSLKINPGREFYHYLPKPGPGQAFLSEGKERKNERVKKRKQVKTRNFVWLAAYDMVNLRVTQKDQAKMLRDCC